MSTEPNPHPLRAPWVCHENGVITDCNGRVVTVLALGNEGCDDARGRVIAKAPELADALRQMVDWHARRQWPASQDSTGSEPSDQLAPIDQQMPEIAQAMRLLAELEVRA